MPIATPSCVLALALAAASCTNKLPASVDAASTLDVPGETFNALGQLCPIAIGGGGTDCPPGNTCKMINGVGTNTMTGYCTPDCMGSDAICSTGYMGPAGAIEKCSLGTSSTNLTGCAIECTGPTQCPQGLSCVSASATTMLCVPS